MVAREPQTVPAKAVMIIPAAGLGMRLHTSTPKALFAVNGKPMLDHLLDLYAPVVERFVIVLHPSVGNLVQRHCERRSLQITYAYQDPPTGMLDAILAPLPSVRTMEVDRVWITWCDQIAVHPDTVRTLERVSAECSSASLIFPTARRRRPYVHFVRDENDRIIDVLHQREGDPMPEIGENDAGLFSLSRDAYLRDLLEFSCDAERTTRTGERNFLPFIPWLTHRAGQVLTFASCDEREAIGVNTPQDVAEVERYLSERASVDRLPT